MALIEFMLLLPMLAFATFAFALLAAGWKVTIPVALSMLLTSARRDAELRHHKEFSTILSRGESSGLQS